ncbi:MULTISPECIES: SGNH/GDSL hydrolase family protein [unclassified Ruegeria]|uniref:SGNH/GDSL hydrolase family protein n=1 Tax=unclassified Ruegeria TaxID=2625375 RepID=UPI001ADB8822|nr:MULTISPECIES: SGNH/GDSL hydrolase family protein [unclassified Ruegeria]MBO9413069.1 SGNH/GDSL hydrolase family protein [Ruegeria sp. R8_1]MBO9416947.1 SGNH/GDSL hydrolase family protein [Ruegeria sp. R8_2]
MPLAADQLLRVPLLPVLAAQGFSVRRNARFLPEPSGPREGREGRGPRLRLLIAGDSSAAGVGAGTQSQALSGCLVRELSRHYAVEWRLEATTGHTTLDTIERLQALNGQFDMAVTALGVNDVTRAVSQRVFMERQSRLLALLTGQLGARRVVVTAVPHMNRFPALPQPLAWVLGQQAARLDLGLREVVESCPQARHLSLDLPDDPALAAPDGYHPSPKTYALWAAEAARLLRQA